MFNFGQFLNAVQHNCHISDAQYAGNYTMCTFLLKMREYYRWEHDIPLSDRLPKDDIGQWLVEREQTWEGLEDSDFTQLPFNNAAIDPFDAETINATLVKQGYIYSSGYGIFNKPMFFLGQLYKYEDYGDIKIYVSACEYARDLAAPPAMLQGNTIYIRFESLRRSIWEKIEEWQWRKDPEHALYHAVKAYGLDLLKDKFTAKDMERLLDLMSNKEIDSIVQHELGEVQAGKLLGAGWEDMLLSLAGNKAEHIARAVRDHLADCLSTLPMLIANNDPAQIHYYFSNFSGIRRGIWPELYKAYQVWRSNNDTAIIADEYKRREASWLNTGKQFLRIFNNEPDDVIKEIESLFAQQLG